MKAHEITLPLGISRAHETEDIEGLRNVLGRFEFIDFNVARISNSAYTIRIKRSRVPEAHGGTMELDETVGGLVGDLLRLTYGQHAELLGSDDSSTAKVRFTSHR